ncbi:ROK family protein [Arthrobacter cupressi]|uniref:Sugar kinase of the NBD/HSP70 family, may contain an N-terminal HTH domain n=1 Tax=Arthrobacter cupressi TaxID=1045773 RepID=A0A1G8N9R5_9MICC|nr:ROK family protein [Arthrobacter cupressi]NYD78307.1 putative NBD/HSP70 family sugar kinase [Arthrobacter cupressi]SDI76807.1 Sugar kinase of the NBD/HSP70 family, may contain an N-terminal HTH domain [Arthrobacter cupressi]
MNSNATTGDYNKASVLDAVLSEAPLTRSRLIELTRLSQATVSRKVDELLFDGFVIEQGVDAVVRRGRPSTYLDVPGTAGHIVGISLGARTTCVLVTDLRGRELGHTTVPSLEGGDLETTGEWLVELIAETGDSTEGPLRQIVAALPGRINGTRGPGKAEPLKNFKDSPLRNWLEDRLHAPVTLESDASVSLRGILRDDASIGNAALFMLSTVLTFASCTDHEIAQGRTPTFGDLGGVLFSGVGNEPLDGLLSTKGLLQFSKRQGLELEGIEALWSQPQEEVSRAKVMEAFTTAIVTAVGAVAVTLDPESVYFVGRLSPLVDEVLPEARRRLAKSLPVVPETRVASQEVGLSVARGAAYAGLALAQSRLRESVLEASRESLSQ